MKTWKPWPGSDCPDCGSGTEYLTNTDDPDGWTTDLDPVRCSDPSCPRHTEDLGHTVVYAEDEVTDTFDPWPIGEDDKPYRPQEGDAK